MGDNLDDLSNVFAMDDGPSLGQAAAEPAPKAKKKRKRAAEEEEDEPVGSDVVQWLRRQGGDPEALSRLEAACEGVSGPIHLLDALPKDRRTFHAEYGPGSVIVLCMSANRCLEVVRALKAKHRCAVAKLFAKHIKLKEQLAELAQETPAICVGTPHRVCELLDARKGGLRASAIRQLLIDGKPDVKSFTMLTHFEASKQLKGLMESHLLKTAATPESAPLSVKVFQYDAPTVSSKD